eukprot:TRINITY_DN113086_c0_g1_i1.p1 TRINITY_DN113086_c0_g1~~TRINITY_DN113086_c0_g1_i1.p1  ORF type:complete len:360 (+),score=51.75 TRINITY_DN113086_c0_g1_i1:60-1139(+)
MAKRRQLLGRRSVIFICAALAVWQHDAPSCFVSPLPARPPVSTQATGRQCPKLAGSRMQSQRGQSTTSPVTRHALPPIISGVVNFFQALLPGASLSFLALFLLQRKLIFLPDGNAVPPTSRLGKPDVILLPTGSNNALERHVAAYYKPLKPNAPVLVFFHGNADQLGYGAAYLADFYRQRHGFGFYGIEYPGYGLAKEGKPTETSLYEAAEAMLQHLQDEYDVSGDRVVLVGQSIGCAVAVEMAKRGFGSKMVLLAPFTSMPDVAGSIYPFLSPLLKTLPFVLLDKFDNAAKAADISIDTLVVHGTADEIVPFSMGEELVDKFQSSDLLKVPGSGHNDLLDRDDVLDDVADFVASPTTS